MFTKNKNKLTLIGFLSYFLTGSLIIVTGTILGNVSQYFNSSIEETSTSFTFLNAGVLTAIFTNLWIIEIISIKKQIFFGFIIFFISIIGLIFSNNLIHFSINMFLIGIVSGIIMSIGTYIITNLYNGKERGVKLLITDSFFSLSGIFIPILSIKMLSLNIKWYWIYILISTIYIVIFFITLNTNFYKLKISKKIEKKIIYNSIQIKLNTIILSICAMFYILAQLAFISWTPEFLLKNKKIILERSGNIISTFWTFYMIGMWFFSFFLKFYNIQKLQNFLLLISSISMYIFIHSNNIKILYCSIIMLGFFSSAIYTNIITLASLQTKIPSSKVVNSVLIAGTIGTLLTFIITKPIVVHYNIENALFFSNLLYLLVLILNYIFGFFSLHKKFFYKK
ncbi:MFS transporter TsgA [Buchnera aphidicola (Kurisakia onigurumii)]|uniref:MFS transporter TsgA n=1 Tax=Buchnera aphidicola TaxID=9 RepID=UPI0031B69BD7